MSPLPSDENANEINGATSVTNFSGGPPSDPHRHVAEQGAERRPVVALASARPQASHTRRRSPASTTCGGTISARNAAVSRFASSSRSPISAKTACAPRSMRAISTSVTA